MKYKGDWMRWLIESMEVVFFVWVFVRMLDVINRILGLIMDVVKIGEMFFVREGVEGNVD